MPKKTKSMELTNRIKQRQKDEDLYNYQVADAVGVTELTLRRWLRCGCDEDHYNRIMTALDDLASGGGPR